MRLRWWRKPHPHVPPTHDEVIRELHELEHTKQKLDEYEAQHNENPATWGGGMGAGLM